MLFTPVDYMLMICLTKYMANRGMIKVLFNLLIFHHCFTFTDFMSSLHSGQWPAIWALKSGLNLGVAGIELETLVSDSWQASL